MLCLANVVSAQNYAMNGTPINDCTGYFTDSGGANGNYGTNENFTTTICDDGTTGTHIRLFFSSIDIGPGETIAFYDAPTADPAFQFENVFLINPDNPFIMQASAANSSGCLTIVFTSDGVNEGNTGWSAAISCVAACQIITSSLVNSNPTVMPVDTGWIDICPGQRVTFNGAGIYPQNGLVYNHSDLTSTFQWTFGDGNSAIGPNVTNVFQEPGGYYVQLEITDQFGCKNTNFLSQRIRVSPYPSFQFAGSLDPTVCSGDSIMITSSIDPLSGSIVSVTPNSGSFQQAGVRSDTLLLPDGAGGFYEEGISFTQFRPGATLTNPADILAVTLELEHSYSGDLDIQLICPDGSSIDLLTYGSGLGSTNFGRPFATAPVDGRSQDLTQGIGFEYSFVEGATNGTLQQFRPMAPQYTYTTVPSEVDGATFTYTDSYFPAGDYRPQQSYTGLLGCPLNGEWRVRVTDNLGLDNGWLFGWSIAFNDNLFPAVENFTPAFMDWGWETNPTVISSSQTELLASPINAGLAAYSFWVEDSFGCVNDTTLTFEVLPPTHPDCFECNMEINQQEDIVLCQGQTATLDAAPANSLRQPITFERFPQAAVGFANHPPGNPYRSVLSVNSIQPATLTNPLQQIASVCFTLPTDFTADLNVVLRGPNGAQLPLALANGGASPLGYVNTCFSPSGLESINFGTPPFTGTYQPEGNWNVLIGNPINGDWTLQVTDGFGPLQFGELQEWSITFNNENRYTYAWTPATGLSSTTSPTPTANPATNTTYFVNVTDLYGCTLRDTILVGRITDIPAPMVSCEALNSSLLFSWLPLSGITQYEYNLILPSGPTGWTGPITDTQVLVENLANNDEVTIEVRAYFANSNANCPVLIGSATCTASFCGLQIDPATLEGVSCFGGTNGSLTVNITAGMPPYSVLVNGTTYNSTTITGLPAGDYSYTVTDGAGCSLLENFTITTPTELVATATQTLMGCATLAQNQAAVTAMGGTGSYTYAWSNGQAAATATNLAAGAYSVVVADANGCQATANAAVADLAPVAFTFASERPSCNGFSDGEISVATITGGVGSTPADYTYAWQDGNTSSTRTDIRGAIPYTLVVTDAQGCSATQTLTLENPIAVTFGFQAQEPSCFQFSDGSISLINLSGPNGSNFNIQWDANANNQVTTTASGLSAGTYSVVVTDDRNCTATQSTSISEPDGVELSLNIKDNVCFGQSQGSIGASASGGSPGYQYQWSNGSSTNTVQNLTAGSYTITITDSRGCTVVQTAEVAQPAALLANTVVANISCYKQRDGRITVVTEGGTPPFRYSLDGQLFTSNTTFLGLVAGGYNVTIRDVNGCEFFTSTTVTEPLELTVDAGLDETIIYGEDIPLVAAVSNAQGDVEYVWSAPYEGTLSCTECPSPTAQPEFTIDYEIYIVDASGCEATDRIRVFVDKPKLAVVPTGFTPNNDGTNDLLLVHGRPGTMVQSFQVFDRWGEQVFSATNFPVNDPTVGWNGQLAGKQMNSDVFIWVIDVIHEDGTEEILRGQTTLIR
jgi:gliding motility-associated-like protein